MADFTKKQLTRATTFDDRRKGTQEDEKAEAGGFTKLSKRAQTFVGGSSTAAANTSLTVNKSGFEDVLYRRYFGMTGESTKTIPPLNANVEKSGPARSRAESFVGKVAANISDKDAIIIVDTFSTGALLANALYAAGYKIICVLSGDLKDLLDMKPEGLEYSFAETFILDTNIEEEIAVDKLLSDIRSLDLNLLAVFAGAETGVELSDQLSERLGLRTNGTALTEARRNKYVMGETIRAAGIRAVKQLHATSWGEIDQWINNWRPEPFQIIVKPMDSAGSDDVTLCHNIGEVQRAFGNIMGKVNGLGIVNKAVLVQEYLDGPEYVVDMVSCDGEHKVMAIWAYDRRPVNGAGFVCFGQRMLTMDEPYCRELVDYQKKVITALGIRHGPTHGEVKWCRGEPVLVEVGARCHGGDGMWVSIADECFGFDQAHATIYAYLDQAKFKQLPNEPHADTRISHGYLKWLINYETGVFECPNPMALREITTMDSYRGHQIFFAPGKTVIPTQNCFSWGGCVKLANKDEKRIKDQYHRIETLEQYALFKVNATDGSNAVSTEGKNRNKDQIVAVVDPFSTGAVLAAELTKLGYSVVAVYSAKLENLANLQNLVPQGLVLSFDAVVPFDDNPYVMINSIMSVKNKKLVAILAGAETGVEVADTLSELMNLKSNGTALTEARRNKYVMGETVRGAGIRAVKQLRSAVWSEIENWIQGWNPQPFEVIVKPMDSAGSDDVTLCRNVGEVKHAFEKIIGKVNGLGIVNKAVLVQEYLDGPEYVIDMVSCDGVHKAVAIYEYDRRVANGAGFVCFGQNLLIADDPRFAEIITYQKQVITALGIRHGPTHGEVKWCRGEPVLVEVGARCHGAEGTWKQVADYVYGYNQVQVTIDSYFHPEKFMDVPEMVSNTFNCLFIVFKVMYFVCSRSQGIHTVPFFS